ncbi:hypothetical protein, partial [Xanthomonas perforans]|uniref:hypothetical protein n=2 Tax=Xanthomonas TaxID=338 RepID=UPI0019D189EE
AIVPGRIDAKNSQILPNRLIIEELSLRLPALRMPSGSMRPSPAPRDACPSWPARMLDRDLHAWRFSAGLAPFYEL